MTTLADLTPEEFMRMNSESIANALGNRGGSASSSGGSGVGSSGAGNALTDSINGVVNATAKFSTGQYQAADALGNATAVLGRLPGVGNILANTLNKVGGTTLTMNQALNDAGQSGGNFGNRLGEAAEAVLGARMTFSEYTDTIRKNSNTISGFGGSVNQGAKALLEFDKKVQETDVARRLVEAGVAQKEINDAGLVYLNRVVGLQRMSEAEQTKAADSAARFAEELDKNARLYGKSRESQLKDIEAQQKKLNVNAYLNQQDNEGRKAYNDMQAAVNPLGKKFMDAADDITMYGQARTKESRLLLSGLDANARELFVNAVRAQKEARDPADKAAADAKMQEAIQAINTSQQSKQLGNAMMQAGVTSSEFSRVQAEALAENKTAQAARNAEAQASQEQQNGKLAQGQDAWNARVKQIIEENAKVVTNEKNGRDKNGNVDPNAAVGRTLNDLNGTMKDFSAGFGKTLNKAASDAGTEITKSGSVLANDIKNALHWRTAEEANRVLDINKLVPGGASPSARGGYDTSKDVKGKSHAIGTLGNFGEFFHDYGSAGFPATLHGEEMVLPKNQLPQFMQQFTSQMKDKIPNPQDLMKQFQGGMQVPNEVSDMVKSTAKASQNMSTPSANSGSATLDDLHNDMQRLNKTMELMVAHTETLKDNSGRQVKATKAMAGNRLA
jgi:hypothetical protein